MAQLWTVAKLRTLFRDLQNRGEVSPADAPAIQGFLDAVAKRDDAPCGCGRYGK